MQTSSAHDFVVGLNDFPDLRINSTPTNDSFYYFYDKKNRRLIRQFVLRSGDRVDHIVQVALIKKDKKFTPRLMLSVRDKNKKVIQEVGTELISIKASVDLKECNENFWKLIAYLQSLGEIDIPQESFSLVLQDEEEIVETLQNRDVLSIANIIRKLSHTHGVRLTQDDITHLLKRREKLEIFKKDLDTRCNQEKKWQNFFEQNKWIFGYGLDYQILRHEQVQPHYGGISVAGKGGQRGDYLVSTRGALNFTVLVEIKTPVAPLLQGTAPIRNGAWSLSKNLLDAITQIQANIATWENDGSRQDENRDRFEKDEKIFTVKPKGIVIIGSLSELNNNRGKRETFQRFRRSIYGIDILTFDELYERARFIAEQKD